MVLVAISFLSPQFFFHDAFRGKDELFQPISSNRSEIPYIASFFLFYYTLITYIVSFLIISNTNISIIEGCHFPSDES